jgi:putative tricarboxylic transport membrane protein
MWKPIASLVFHGVLIVVLATALYFSLDWPPETALFPQAVGAPILALTIVSLGLQMHHLRRAGIEAVNAELEADSEPADAEFLKKAAVEFAWLIGFGLAIWLIGFYPAAFLFLLLYLKAQAELGWGFSLLWSISAVAVVFVFFYLLLHLDPYGGLIVDLVNWP